MTEEIQAHFLKIISDLWLELPPEHQPPNVWIECGSPMSLETNNPIKPPFIQGVWLLNARGVSQRDIWEYRRFDAVHHKQPWNRLIGLPSIVTLGDREAGTPPLFGHTFFAPYAESDMYQLEVRWGPLYGRGWKVSATYEGPFEREGLLWIS